MARKINSMAEFIGLDIKEEDIVEILINNSDILKTCIVNNLLEKLILEHFQPSTKKRKKRYLN